MADTRKKVLIITYYWPPSGGSGVQRWLKFVKYLRDFGWEPIIYTPENPDFDIKDASLLEEIPKDIKIVKRPIWEPYKLANFFSKKGQDSTNAGFIDDASSRSVFGKIKYWIRANWFIPDPRRSWVSPSVKFLSKYLKEQPVDVIVSTGPPHSMHLIALKLQEHHDIPWLADFRDPWTNIDFFHKLPFSKGSLAKHHQLEQRVLKNADQVVVVGNTMRQEFLAHTDHVSVILNGHDLPKLATYENTLDKEFSIAYIGSLNEDRNPEMLWQVLGELTQQNVSFAKKIIIRLIGKVSEKVSESIKSFGLKDHLQLVGYVAHSEAQKFQQRSQLLLLLVNNVPSAKGIVTGKVFEYIASGRPILAIGPTDGDLAAILDESGAGTIFDFKDAISLKAHILQLFSTYESGKLVGNASEADKYSRKEGTRQLAKLLNDMTE
ncbi:glycosyltransferase [Sungkyunkwania multivorans]|uniref:Glycosyltransferase n=1 Tax=Sungkyunkwania multivorans TaxID=1173618 RepID=A0ABW3D0F1_9FLAO